MALQAKSKARRKPPRRRPQRLLTLEEIDRLRAWGHAQIARGDRAGALVVALLGTGGRRFEVAALRCRDILIGPGGPEVHFPETKGGGEETIPISDETFRALVTWIHGKPGTSPLIPTTSGQFMHPATLWRLFRETLLAAGIERELGVHASRHAAGFLLLRATNDLTKVQAFLRHKTLSTTANWYAHVHMPDLREGLRKAGL